MYLKKKKNDLTKQVMNLGTGPLFRQNLCLGLQERKYGIIHKYRLSRSRKGIIIHSIVLVHNVMTLTVSTDDLHSIDALMPHGGAQVLFRGEE